VFRNVLAKVASKLLHGVGDTVQRLRQQRITQSLTFKAFAGTSALRCLHRRNTQSHILLLCLLFHCNPAVLLDRVVGRDAMSRMVSLYFPLRQFIQFNRFSSTERDIFQSPKFARRGQTSQWDALPAHEKNHTVRYLLAFLSSLVMEAVWGHLKAVLGPVLSRFKFLQLPASMFWDSNQLKLLRAALFVGLWAKPHILLAVQHTVVSFCNRDITEATMQTPTTPNAFGQHSGFWDSVEFPQNVVPVSADSTMNSEDSNGPRSPDFVEDALVCRPPASMRLHHSLSTPMAVSASTVRRTSEGFRGSHASSSGGVTWIHAGSSRPQSALLVDAESVVNAVNADRLQLDSEADTTMEREKSLAEQVEWAVEEQKEVQTLRLRQATEEKRRRTPLANHPLDQDHDQDHDWGQGTTEPQSAQQRPPPPSRGTKPRVSTWLRTGRPSVGYNRLQQVAAVDGVTEGGAGTTGMSMSSLDLLGSDHDGSSVQNRYSAFMDDSGTSSQDSITGVAIGEDFPQTSMHKIDESHTPACQSPTSAEQGAQRRRQALLQLN